MPTEKYVLILVSVLAAAGVTVGIGIIISRGFDLTTIGWVGLLPIFLGGYVIWRIISERLSNRDDDYYDHFRK